MYRFNSQLSVRFFFFLYHVVFFISQDAFAQFPPAAGLSGSTAIYKDSSCLIYFANQCTYFPGYKNIASPDSGRLAATDVSAALGRPDGVSLSLGDSGYVIIPLNTPLYNEAGFDFAVFENSFSDQFLELAFVEVSSDGSHFLRFPSYSFTPVNIQQGPFDNNMQASLLHNLAGKYRGLYGTPFDLDDLPDSAWLNKDSIIAIRITDVIGSIDSLYASRDAEGRVINDPFPTPFTSGGFDLDGIGFIHARYTSSSSKEKKLSPFFFPSFCRAGQTIHFTEGVGAADVISIYDIHGHLIKNILPDEKWTPDLADGAYILSCKTSKGVLTGKLLVGTY